MTEPMPERSHQRLNALRRYASALDRGDFAELARVLQEAEADAALDRMVVAWHESMESVGVSGDVGAQDGAASDGAPLPAFRQQAESVWHSPEQWHARREKDVAMAMIEAPVSEDASLDLAAPAATRAPQRLRRADVFVGAIAAVLIVGFLLSGFFTLFSMQRPQQSTQLVPLVRVTSTGLLPTDGEVIVDTESGSVSALRPSDVALFWRAWIGNPHISAGTEVGNIAVRAQRVFVTTTQGDMYALSVTDGVLLWHRTFAGIARLEFFDDEAVVSDFNGVYGVSTSDGTQLWSRSGWVLWGVGTINGTDLAFVSASAGATDFDAITALDNRVLWHYLGLGSLARIFATNTTVYAEEYGSDIATFAALRGETGEEIWSRQVPNYSFYSFALDQQQLYFTAAEGVDGSHPKICSWALSDGAPLWCTSPVLGGPTYLSFWHGAIYLVTPIIVPPQAPSPDYQTYFRWSTIAPADGALTPLWTSFLLRDPAQEGPSGTVVTLGITGLTEVRLSTGASIWSIGEDIYGTGGVTALSVALW